MIEDVRVFAMVTNSQYLNLDNPKDLETVYNVFFDDEVDQENVMNELRKVIRMLMFCLKVEKVILILKEVALNQRISILSREG